MGRRERRKEGGEGENEPALQVSLLSPLPLSPFPLPFLNPFCKWTLANGIPVGVSNAGSSLRPRSCARCRSSLLYQGREKPLIGEAYDEYGESGEEEEGEGGGRASKWPERRPPIIRMVISKT